MERLRAFRCVFLSEIFSIAHDRGYCLSQEGKSPVELVSEGTLSTEIQKWHLTCMVRLVSSTPTPFLAYSDTSLYASLSFEELVEPVIHSCESRPDIIDSDLFGKNERLLPPPFLTQEQSFY